MADPTLEKIAAVRDGGTHEKRLAQSISLSLRNMDISVEQIAEYYHEQLVNILASGRLDGRVATTLDQTLFAHVHSFFMHLGAARDYLAALLAKRIGKDPQKIDSMARLVETLRAEHFSSDKLLDLLQSRSFIRSSPTKANKWEISGWLKEASALRNEFVHRRPYGSRFMEQHGYAMPVIRKSGLFRYVRPLVIAESAEHDVLDVIAYHYRNSTSLFQDLAEASGYDASMLKITL